VPQERIQLACLIDIEGMAAEIVNWSPQLVPGLLQVPGYTRSIMERAQVARHLDAVVGATAPARLPPPNLHAHPPGRRGAA
ncbi:DUF5753 domain-containing protein, partial [Saccharothrix sp. MB29]|nr:DUF5753 domain-containing protein [Saccharothrix sp. MB29]